MTRMVDRLRAFKPQLPSSLRVRVALPFILLSIIIFSSLNVFVGRTVERHYLNSAESDMRAHAEIVALSISGPYQPGQSIEETARFLESTAALTESRFTLIDEAGAVLVDTDADVDQLANHNDRAEVRAARSGDENGVIRVSDSTGNRYLYVAVKVPESPGWILRLATPITEVEGFVLAIQRAILTAVIVSLIATLVASWFFAGRLAAPLQTLKMHAMRIAVGDYSVRVRPYDIDEINSVGRAFNRMAERLEDVIDRQEQTSLRLESVMEGLIDGVILTDADSLVLRVNPAAEKMLGIRESEVRGKPFVQAARDYEIARVLASAFDGKTNPTATVDHGIDHRAIQVLARSIEGSHQQELGLVVLRDVTEIRRLEAVRREFVANVSHELRTPLTSIRAMVETLEAGAIEEPDIAMEFLGRIVGEITRLNALVEDVLDFARLEAGRTPLRLEYVNVGDVVVAGANRLQPQIERAGLSIEIDLGNDLPEMALDVGRIEQVLINLIHNAIKFTPAGGKLTLRVYRERNTVYVSLKDTGVGISDEEQHRLFERFYKSDKARRSEGTGLGLAIAKNIVQLHGGTIRVESTVGEGSEFTFSLPLKRKKAEKRARKHSLSGLL